MQLVEQPIDETGDVMMRLGKIVVRRMNAYNFTVNGDGRTRYYGTLGVAVSAAARVASDVRAKDARDWAIEYAKTARQVENSLQRYENKDKEKVPSVTPPKRINPYDLSAIGGLKRRNPSPRRGRA